MSFSDNEKLLKAILSNSTFDIANFEPSSRIEYLLKEIYLKVQNGGGGTGTGLTESEVRALISEVIKGYYVVVANTQERNNIPSGSRFPGMVVYVTDIDTCYRWTGTAWHHESGLNVENIVDDNTLKVVDGKLVVNVSQEVIEGDTNSVSGGAVYNFVMDQIDDTLGDIEDALTNI